MVKHLLQYGANRKAKTSNGDCFLHYASQLGSDDVLDYFFNNITDLDMDIENNDGTTPLDLAVLTARSHFFHLLTDYGATVGNRNPPRRLCHLAVQPSTPDVRLELLKYDLDWSAGANFYIYSNFLQGAQPIHVAAGIGTVDAVRFLLSNKLASVDSTAANGTTPLHLAASRNFEECVRTLIEYGADPNLSNTTTGEHLLHIAARGGFSPLAQILLQGKCNPAQKNRDGHTPLETARACNHLEFAAIIGDFFHEPESAAVVATMLSNLTSQSLHTHLPIRTRKPRSPGFLPSVRNGTSDTKSSGWTPINQAIPQRLSQDQINTANKTASDPSLSPISSQTQFSSDSLEPKIFELRPISETGAAELIQKIQSAPTPAEAEVEPLLAISPPSSSSSERIAEPTYIAWRPESPNERRTQGIKDAPPTPFIVLDQDMKPILEGMMKGVRFKRWC